MEGRYNVVKAKFKNEERYHAVGAFAACGDVVTIKGDTITENLSGFILYEDDEKTVIRDYSAYVYKWNIYTDYTNGIALTKSETNREREPIPCTTPPQEIIDPLTNEELTSTIAELLYETSLMQLGMEVE